MPLSLRVTPELKEKLDNAAQASGRSQTQEIEFRLERSFDRSELLPETMALTYGRELAGLLMVMGQALKDSSMLSVVMLEPTGESLSAWFQDPFVYDQAAKALYKIVNHFRPNGEVVSPPRAQSFAKRSGGEEIGSQIATAVLDAVAGRPGTLALRGFMEQVRPLLGRRAVEESRK